MTRIKLTSEQEAVVDSPSKRLVVSAAAGAGKTSVLVQRYVKHVVQDGIRPDHILAITFTKKAAAEMKLRIIRQLLEDGLYDEARVAETGPIQTIHSFCERLLRENCLEAGLDPAFEILSDSLSKQMLERAIQQSIAESGAMNRYAAKLIEQLAGKRRWGEDRNAHNRLAGAIRDTLASIRGSGYKVSEIQRRYETPEDVIALWRRMALESVPSSVIAIADSQIVEGLFSEVLGTAYKEANVSPPTWFAKKHGDNEFDSACQTAGLVHMVCAAWSRMDTHMQSSQMLDFCELETRAVKLLENSKMSAERVRRQYRVALIDESQDVNPLQHRLIEAINAEIGMFVGDPQQSIYAFRQADPNLFIERSKASEISRLSLNHRSKNSVLDFVNTLFSERWGASYEPMRGTGDSDDSEPAIEFWLQRTKDPALTAYWVGKLIESGIAPQKIAVLVRKGKTVAGLLTHFEEQGVEARVVGGTDKFYTRMEIRDVANALRSVSDPYDDFALLCLLRGPLVGLSLDSIVMLATASPIVEALSTFEPPVKDDCAKLSEFRDWYDKIRSYADRLSAWECMSHLMSHTPLLDRLAQGANSRQALANARKLLTLAADDPHLGPLEYANQLREVQGLKHQEGDAPIIDGSEKAVTISTIHKAKGLEYDAVILPDLYDKAARKMGDIEMDSRNGLISVRFGKSLCWAHTWLSELRKAQEREEEWRVLYVAMTRAKERLCLCVHPKASAESFARQICDLLKFVEEAPRGVKLREFSHQTTDENRDQSPK